MARAWFEKRERGSAWLLARARVLALWMGRTPALGFLWLVTVYFYAFSRDGRAGIRAYYEHLLGRAPGARRIFHHYFRFAQTILDRAYLLARHKDAPRLLIRGFDAIYPSLVEGGGAILLGAHLGSFEAARAAAFEHPELKIQVLMDAEISRKLNNAMSVLCPGMHESVVSLGSPAALLRVKETLAQGGLVGMMGDRVRPDELTYRQDFLGDEALFPLGPLRLAAALRVPVFFFASTYRTAVDGSATYEVVFELLCGPAPGIDGRTQWLQELGRRYVAALESHCRIVPDNWFNFYDFWHPQIGQPLVVDWSAQPARRGSGASVDRAYPVEDLKSHDEP